MPKPTRRKLSSPRTRAAASRRATARRAKAARTRRPAKTAAKPRAAARRALRRAPTRRDADRALRELLIAQIEGGHAHATFAQAIEGLPAAERGVRPQGAAHSAWEVLEHLRISQWDIVEFTRDPAHRSPTWPSGYWPSVEGPPSEAAWRESVRAFEEELDVMKALLRDPRRALFAKVEHPEAKAHHTLAREAMVLAVHNGYHIGELIVVRRLLGSWPPR